MASASCFFFVFLNIFDFITDIFLAITLCATMTSGGISLGTLLAIVSIIGLCLGLRHVNNQSKQPTTNEYDNGQAEGYKICTLKMCKLFVEDIPSMIIVMIISISGIGTVDCTKKNFIGMTLSTQAIIASMVSAFILVITFLMECGMKPCKYGQKCKGFCGCLCALVLIFVIISIWTTSLLMGLGCES